MMRNSSIAIKLALLMLVCCSFIFFVVLVYNYNQASQILVRDAQSNTRNLTLATTNRIEGVLEKVEKVVNNVAVVIERHPFSADDYREIVGDIVRNNREIFGSTIAFEPAAVIRDAKYFAPYAYRDRGVVKFSSIEDPAYDYFSQDWYLIPKELEQPHWSEPYFDEGGGDVLMTTYSTPLYRRVGNGRHFVGIITADVALSWLRALTASSKVYESGYIFVLSRNGNFVTHPQSDFAMRESIFSVAAANKDSSLRGLGKRMLSGETGFVPLRDFSSFKPGWLSFAPLTNNGWSIGLFIPEDELFSELYGLTGRLGIIGFFGLFGLTLGILLISQRFVRPIQMLVQKTNEIAKGNLDTDLPSSKNRDEVGELTDSFQQMRKALKEHIAHLAETTAAKERIESELKIARTIQMNFLPKSFPPFAKNIPIDLYAFLEPAKEVGGDFYDFFMLDERHLFFAVGDVSDKGVPAALFMAVTKTLLKGTAESTLAPSALLEHVNRELAEDNDASMFVTLVCGILDCETGFCRYSNAGHNPPLVLHCDGRLTWLELPPGFVLGAMSESRYETREICLAQGDALLLYTDGVTEAMDSSQTLFGTLRLYDVVAERASLGTEKLVKEVYTEVERFAGDAPQADDITLMMLKRRPGAEGQE